jgi:hypothetical protein
MKSKKCRVFLFYTFVILVFVACEPTPTPPPPKPVANQGGSTTSTETEFDPSNANQVPPEDVLGEVTYFSGGGWGSVCEGATNPTLVILPSSSTTHEWMASIYFESCGWKSDETVTVTVIFPDSSRMSEDLTAGGGTILYEIKPTRSMPPGKYTIRVEGVSGHVEDTTTVIVPSPPRMYSIEENWLVLYNFSPNEEIRLFAYEPGASDTMHLTGWKQYRADSSGKLEIQIPGKGAVYYAVGDISGLVNDSGYYRRNYGLVWESDLLISNCGGLPSQLSVRMRARATFTGEIGKEVRERPGFSENIKTTLPEGTTVEILNARKCVENSTWWLVRTDEGIEGWMAEDQNDKYMLEPYSCTLQSHLYIGLKARVVVMGRGEMPVRGKPGLEQDIVGTVPEGTSFVIVGSSRCADDILWWPVRTDDGVLGWMPEEQDGVYLLEPYP